MSVRFEDGYLLSRARAPELIVESDLVKFDMEGRYSSPHRPYAERMIHGAIYEARPDVQAVVHSHSYDVIPFGVTGTPIRPMTHTCAPIGSNVPVWDIRAEFGETNHLVSTMEQGRDLARTLSSNQVALLKRHGAVVVGSTLRAAVLTAIYLQVAARMQRDARLLGGASDYLTDAEISLCTDLQLSPLALDRAWEAWEQRILKTSLGPHANSRMAHRRRLGSTRRFLKASRS